VLLEDGPKLFFALKYASKILSDSTYKSDSLTFDLIDLLDTSLKIF